MNRYVHNYNPPKRKPKKKHDNKKLGLVMLLLGIFTVLALFLPLKLWVLMLSCALIIFGCLLK